jgi:hypothetical protein
MKRSLTISFISLAVVIAPAQTIPGDRAGFAVGLT